MKKIIRIVLFIAIIALVAFVLYRGFKKDDSVTTDNPLNVAVQELSRSQPAQTTQTNDPVEEGSVASVTDPVPAPAAGQSLPEPVVTAPAALPTPTVTTPPVVRQPVANPAPRPTPPAPQASMYRAQNGLVVSVPAGMRVQEQVSGTSNELILVSNSTNSAVGRIYSYSFTADSLATIQEQLKASPEVRNIKSISVTGIPALQYDSSSGNTFALIRNGTLYYYSSSIAKYIAFQ